MPIKIEKIIKEFEKGSVDEQIEAFNTIKEVVSATVLNEQKKLEEKSTQLQSTLDRINGQ